MAWCEGDVLDLTHEGDDDASWMSSWVVSPRAADDVVCVGDDDVVAVDDTASAGGGGVTAGAVGGGVTAGAVGGGVTAGAVGGGVTASAGGFIFSPVPPVVADDAAGVEDVVGDSISPLPAPPSTLPDQADSASLPLPPPPPDQPEDQPSNQAFTGRRRRHNSLRTSLSLLDDQPTEVQDEQDGMAENIDNALVPCAKGQFDSPLFRPPPSLVVETSSLSLVALPTITTKLILPRHTVQAHLSQDQLLAVGLCLEKHQTIRTNGKRSGFLLGDGTGVGKTRTAGAVVFQYVLSHLIRHGGPPPFPCLWFSANRDLMPAVQREMHEIGAGQLQCVRADKFFRATFRGTPPHVLFSTYAFLVNDPARFFDWLPADYDGVVVLDECHMANNVSGGRKRWGTSGKSSATASAVYALQEKFPRARVVYVTATAAALPRHFLNMDRLGLWGDGTAFASSSAFVEQMETNGLASMEMVALHMKQHGQFVSRHLSFSECEFSIVSVAPDTDFAAMYDRCVALWQKLEEHISDFQWLNDPAKPDKARRLFYMNMYDVFRMLMVCAKLPTLVELVHKALEQGYACVVGLEQTGQAAMALQTDSSNDLFSAVEARLLRFVDVYFSPKVTWCFFIRAF